MLVSSSIVLRPRRPAVNAVTTEPINPPTAKPATTIDHASTGTEVPSVARLAGAVTSRLLKLPVPKPN